MVKISYKHMKPSLILTVLFIAMLYITIEATYPFDFYQANNDKIEKLILKRVRALPEVKEWFRTARKSKPDLILNEPDAKNKYYSIQVGISNLDMFRTSYYLYVDPKTFKIYYWDELDETGNGIITLQQWRHWRTNPGFQKRHIYKDGELVVLKGK